jgi:hypothetical protein
MGSIPTESLSLNYDRLVYGDTFDFNLTSEPTATEPLDVDGSVPTETLTLNWDKVVWRYNDGGIIDDLAVDPNNPDAESSAQSVLCDGSVRFVSNDIYIDV